MATLPTTADTSSSRTAQIVACLVESPSGDGAEVLGLADSVSVLEVRADLVGDLDPDWLRHRFPGRLLYTLRSRGEGGRFDGSARRRRERLRTAAERFDMVDLEAERDLDPELLDDVPVEQRLLSWHGTGDDLARLRKRCDLMLEVPAALYKLVPAATQSGQELVPLDLLLEVGRNDVVAFASGDVGVWTRLVAPRLGAPWVYGSLSDRPAAPGQLSVNRLLEDFGLPDLPEITRYFGIVGNPVAHSLSPRLHNGAYRALGIAANYLPFHAEGFGDFWLEVVEGNLFGHRHRPLAGLSVTAPFKSAALAVAGASSPLAKTVESANTLVQRQGVWEAETTDPEGVLGALRTRHFELQGRQAAVLGCGGAGRAAAAGLLRAGAHVTMVNRGLERGRAAAANLGVPFVPLEEFSAAGIHVLVHATSLGHDAADELPIAVASLSPDTVVVDMVYAKEPTALVEAVRSAGLLAIDGREVLLHQALGQFRMMTDQELPWDLGCALLGLEEPR